MSRCVQTKSVFGYDIGNCNGDIEYHVYPEDIEKLDDCQLDRESCSHHVPIFVNDDGGDA